MNILFLTLIDFSNLDASNIYSDLMNEFVKNGHNTYIVSPSERRNKIKTHLISGSNYQIIKLKIGNIQKTNIIEKGISTLLIDNQFKHGIKKYYKNIKIDLILYSTPPISFIKTIKYIKQKYNSLAYLLLKDIFPQNAVDLGMLKTSGLMKYLYEFFRNKEEKLYKISDKIGCMSEANKNYVLKHNPKIGPDKVEVNPNSIKYELLPTVTNKRDILAKYNIDEYSTIFIYGGNLGKPQGIDFLCDCISQTSKIKSTINIIVGSGTEFKKIENHININNILNTILIPSLPKKDFDELLTVSDVGMIFLDNRFTIPNYPSRLLSYMQANLPILLSSDSSTDLRNHIIEWNIGLCNRSDNVEAFIVNYKKLMDSKNRYKYKKNISNILKTKFNVELSYEKIINLLNDRG